MLLKLCDDTGTGYQYAYLRCDTRNVNKEDIGKRVVFHRDIESQVLKEILKESVTTPNFNIPSVFQNDHTHKMTKYWHQKSNQPIRTLKRAVYTPDFQKSAIIYFTTLLSYVISNDSFVL